MTTPSYGSSISWTQIQTEFGGSIPIGLTEYYAGAGYTPAGTVAQFGAIPTTSTISAYNMFGATADPLASFTYLYTMAFGVSNTNVIPFISSARGVHIELWGGGGGGAVELGGVSASAGASGGYASKKYVDITTGTSYSVVIVPNTYVAGGTNVNGLTGGSASIPSLGLYAYGGQGGSIYGSAAAGGTASGGTINTTGNSSPAYNTIGKGAPNGGGDSITYGTTYGGGGAAYRGTLTYINYGGGYAGVKFNVYGIPGFNTVYASLNAGLTDYGSGGGASVTLSISSNGTTSMSGENRLANYYYPTTVGIGNNWWVRFNYISGYSGTASTFTTYRGQWRALNTGVAYTLSVASTTKITYASRGITGTLSFSNDGGATVYYTTGNLSFDVVDEGGILR